MAATYEFGHAEGGIVAPAGFLASGVAAGIKKSGKRDVVVLAAKDGAVPAAAVFTTNTMAAAPVHLSRANVAGGTTRAVVANSGNANACTGEPGAADAAAMAAACADALGCDAGEVLVASTGVIGVALPMDAMLPGIADAVAALDDAAGDAAAEGIMTTDTFVKQTALTVSAGGTRYTVGGMAKGSGMIRPDMATMLAFVTTDAPLTSAACEQVVRAAVARTFNRITVDSDTSTNDMLLLMASGEAGGPALAPGDPACADAYEAVAAAVTEVCERLAKMIVRDGEGATKFVTITVTGAVSEADAERAAFSIADSPLVKTALFGADANWGRVVSAVGKSGAQVDPAKLDVTFAGIPTCVGGTGLAFDEDAAAAALAETDIDVAVDLHLGSGEATVWTCDLSYEYVRINGEYRS
ncbi:MAG: bifunctional glutamate N-acetyltransferase/amino-acid acetyltransferase ArgJ [Actinobacteria bacterium]|nr:MAG: bifunctional glutamate N-acetyltransferase/amino-acid acetyltransferase ArgJ [Actinomycetota bacterium]